MPPIERRLRVNDIDLCIFEWGQEHRDAGEPILLAHATGFHARCWDRVIEHLPKRYVVAVDQRGHGRSDTIFPVRWQDFGRDLAGLVRALDLTDTIGVGHSMGGHAVTEAAAAEPHRFRRLVLIDPVIASPEAYANAPAVPSDAAHPTVRRRRHWASPAEMFERFRSRPPFDAWDTAVLRDYCEHGLRPNPSGDGYVLACSPEFEAQTYLTSRDNGGVHASIAAVDLPVVVVRAMEPTADRDTMDFRYSPTWPKLASAFPRGRDLHLPERTHFLPMEDPRAVARIILDS